MKPLRNRILRLILVLMVLAVLILFVFPFGVYKYVNHYSEPYMYTNAGQVPQSHTVLVLGAGVLKNNRISYILYDRLLAGVELYKSKKVSKFLLSGDHGQKDYDEVNTMKYHLLKIDINADDIFLDHAGFDTYDSVTRASRIFGVKDVVIVTQRFHLPRAIFIARHNGLNVYGYVADKRKYSGMRYYKIREMYARVKTLIDVLFNADPKYLGKKISIYEDSKKSWD